MPTKISQAAVQAMLREVPVALRKVASERDFWKEKALAMMAEDEVQKVASEIRDRGLDSGRDLDELLEDLRKAASQNKLATIREGLSWVGPNMGEKIASLGDRPGKGTTTMERLEAAILE